MHASHYRSPRAGFVATLFACYFVAACGAGAAPLLTADPSGTLLFEQGQDALVAEEWDDAISSFDTLLRNYPASPFLAEARLGAGQAYYQQGRADSLILAIDSFQSFLTYHPSHAHVDYAQFMVAKTHMEQMGTPDRDQTQTRRAIDAWELFLENYPDSRLRGAAEDDRQIAIDALAEHEYEVARWQATRKEDWDAAVDRVAWALEQYPETTLKCDLYFVLASAYETAAEAVAEADRDEHIESAARHYQLIVDEYAGCELVEDALDRLKDLNGG